MKVYVVQEIVNRDDAGEVIASNEAYVEHIVGVYATYELAKAAALATKKDYFRDDLFNYNHPDDLEHDEVYQQAHDDRTLDVQSDDYEFAGNWGEFYVQWAISEHEVKGA